MGLEASCLMPNSGAHAGCNQVGAKGSNLVTAGCFVPCNNACMAPYDVRSVSARNGDPQVPSRFRGAEPRLSGRPRPGAPPCEVLEMLPFRPGAAVVLSPGACGPAFCGASAALVQLEARYGSSEEAARVARQYVKDDNPQQAFSAYWLAYELDEENAALCDEFGQFMLSHSQLDGAECMFNRALALDPMNPEYLYRRGVVLQQRRQFAEAAETFTMALQQDPRSVGALFNLGIVHRDLGDHRSAVEDFRRILQINPDNHCALALLGESLAELGDIDGALRSLEESLRIDPTNRSAQRDLQRLRQSQRAGTSALWVRA